MIDFHTHILPCIDDGSKSLEMSLEMLRREAEQGISAVIFTPHFYAHQNSPEKFLERRNNAFKKVMAVLPAGMPELHLGAEVQYFDGICQVENLNRLCVDGGRHLLLEMPFSKWSHQVVQDALELQSRDSIQVTLAHIERYFDFAEKDMWEALRSNGVQMQCNATFFLNWKTRHKAIKMYKDGFIDLLGSDCHNLTTRPPNLAEAIPYIEKYL